MIKSISMQLKEIQSIYYNLKTLELVDKKNLILG